MLNFCSGKKQEYINKSQKKEKTQKIDTLYAWVDNLSLRAELNLKAKPITKLKEGEGVSPSKEISQNTAKVMLRGKTYESPFIKVTTQKGVVGWVFKAALSSEKPVFYEKNKNTMQSFMDHITPLYKAIPSLSYELLANKTKLLSYQKFFKNGLTPLVDYGLKEDVYIHEFIKEINLNPNKPSYRKIAYAYSYPSGYLFFTGKTTMLFYKEKIPNKDLDSQSEITDSKGKTFNLYGYDGNPFYYSSLYMAPFKPLPCGIQSYMKQEEVLKILGPALLQTKEAFVYKIKLKDAREIFIYLIFNKEGKLYSIVFDNISVK